MRAGALAGARLLRRVEPPVHFDAAILLAHKRFRHIDDKLPHQRNLDYLARGADDVAGNGAVRLRAPAAS
ncbi:MAG TPA: hypothetical protein VH643_08930 [Gemmataceae bacterium]